MAENIPCAICGSDPVAGRLARMFGHRPDIAWAELAKLTREHEALGESHSQLLAWTKAALECPSWHWDGDQRAAAEQSVEEAERIVINQRRTP